MGNWGRRKIASIRSEDHLAVDFAAEVARSCRKIATQTGLNEAEQQLLSSVHHALKCDFVAYFALSKPNESMAFFLSRGIFERDEEEFSSDALLGLIREEFKNEFVTQPLRLSLSDSDMDQLFSSVESRRFRQGLVLTLPAAEAGLVYVLLVGFREPYSHTAPAIEFLNALMSVVDLAKQKVATGQRFKSEHERVVRAKQEWQSSVDVLNQLICLVNPSGKVVRANRALEQLGLGRVTEVRGKFIWELLGLLDGTNDGRVVFSGDELSKEPPQDWATHWQSAIDCGSTVWDTGNQTTGRCYRIAINFVDLCRSCSQDSKEHAVVVIDDITLSQMSWLGSEDGSNELMLDVERKSNELKIANRRLKSLSNELINTQEEERKRVALELHDGLGQTLTMTKLRFDCILEELNTSLLVDPVGRIKEVREDLRNCIAEVHRIGMNLRPPMLDDLGIGATLSWFFREYSKTSPDIDLSIKIAVDECLLDASLKTEIFRITQEAMNNIAKHSHASNVKYRLTLKDDRIYLRIKDNGVGFDANDLTVDGSGFKNMQERVFRKCGHFALKTAPGAGVKISADWQC